MSKVNQFKKNNQSINQELAKHDAPPVVNRQQTKKDKKKKQKESVTVPSSSTSSVQQVISYLDTRRDSTCDEIDDLFRAYAKTVKKFPPRRQAFVKFKISKILMDEELAYLDQVEQEQRNQERHSSSIPQHRYSETHPYRRNSEIQERDDSSPFHRPTSTDSSLPSFTSSLNYSNSNTLYRSEPSSSATWYEDFGNTLHT